MHESKIHAYKEQDEVLFYKWAKLIYYFFQRKKYIKKESFPFFLLPWPILGQVSWLSSKVGIKEDKKHLQCSYPKWIEDSFIEMCNISIRLSKA